VPVTGRPSWRAGWARDRIILVRLPPARALRRFLVPCRRRRRRVPGTRQPARMIKVATFSAAVYATAGSTEV
jgi:hypothetical protein